MPYLAAASLARRIGAGAPGKTAGGRRAELVYRESHTVEQTAGIVFMYFLADLFRNTVFYCIHQVLGRTLNADDREETQGNDQFVSFGVADVAAGYCAANSLRNFVTAAATAAAILFRFYNLAGKDNRIHCFYDSNGKVGGHGAAAAVLRWAEAGAVVVALEYTYIALAAKQNYLLFYNSDTFYFLYISRGNTRFAGYTNIDLDRQLVEPSVEGNTININVRPNDSGTFAANCNTSINKFLAIAGQKYTYILETVLVATGIKNPVCIDTYHFPGRGLALSVIRHIYYTSYEHKTVKLLLPSLYHMRRYTS